MAYEILYARKVDLWDKIKEVKFSQLSCVCYDDLNGSVGSIADLILKGPGFESQISHGFSSCKRG
jgi:hypothetical protein